jgi:hypothetical protein
MKYIKDAPNFWSDFYKLYGFNDMEMVKNNFSLSRLSTIDGMDANGLIVQKAQVEKFKQYLQHRYDIIGGKKKN